MNDKITLIDGSKLDCYPIALPSEETVSGEFSLDTTGEYLQVGKKPHFVTDKELAERRKQEEIDAKLFYEHIHLFLANADKILSDSRLFLSPVNVVNGLAYTGTSGFLVKEKASAVLRLASISSGGYITKTHPLTQMAVRYGSSAVRLSRAVTPAARLTAKARRTVRNSIVVSLQCGVRLPRSIIVTMRSKAAIWPTTCRR